MAAVEDIQLAVAKAFKVTVEDLKGQSSPRAISIPRQVAMYLARRLTGTPLQEIGTYFGGRHRTTVEYAIARVEQLRGSDAALDPFIEKLCCEIQRGPGHTDTRLPRTPSL